MNIGFAVNAIEDVVSTQTTLLLMHAALRRGHTVLAFGARDLTLLPDGGIAASARQIAREPGTPAELVAALRATAARNQPLDGLPLLLARTNPARDEAHRSEHATLLAFCQLLKGRGTVVLNDPAVLACAGGKLFLAHLAGEHVPSTLVSADPAVMRAFVRESGGLSVVKPLEGTRGTDVFRVSGEEGWNLDAMVEVVCRSGYGIAQGFVPAAEEGDVRIVTVDGELLEVDGKVAAIHRVPPSGSFRSNVHQGGTPQAVTLTDVQRAVAEKVARRVRAAGIFLAGIDLVGVHVLEINVFSTGGLRDAERFYSADYTGALIDRFVAQVPG